MEVTLDLPEPLVRQIEAHRGDIGEIIERGLRHLSENPSPHWKEIIQFLATSPSLEQIVAFQPSAEHRRRSRDLLQKNEAAQMSATDEDELDELGHINHLMTLLKIEARRSLVNRTKV